MAILIVDDSRDEQELLSNRLQAAGYESLLVADSAETALGILGQVEAGERAGAMDYVRKPVNSELVARVSSALALRAERIMRKGREQELLMRTQELEHALREVKVLRGFIPICANCKRVRTDTGDWQRLEDYIQKHSEAEFSHGICQRCIREKYPEVSID